MTTRTDDDTPCRICNQSYGWHVEHRPRHEFVPPDNSGGMAQLGRSNRDRRTTPGSRDEPKSNVKVLRGLPSDPALRILMLRKGVITQDELNEVEREIREAQESGSIVVVMPDTARTSGGGGPDPESGSRTGA